MSRPMTYLLACYIFRIEYENKTLRIHISNENNHIHNKRQTTNIMPNSTTPPTTSPRWPAANPSQTPTAGTG